MGLHICEVANRTTDSRGEFVEVANDGFFPATLTGLALTDYTETQQDAHIYRFPAAVDGVLQLAPGRSAYIFTGSGQNERLSNGDLLLFWGRRASVWNDDGDVAYLRNAQGEFIDHLTVGSPKRHPGGH